MREGSEAISVLELNATGMRYLGSYIRAGTWMEEDLLG